MAVGGTGWQGGTQYTLNILNAINSVAGDKAIEVNLFKGSTQQFFDLEKFTSIKLTVAILSDVLPPLTFVNRVRWFIQRKFLGAVNPRIESYLIANRFDYVFPAVLSSHGGKLNVGSWIADFQYHHFPNGASKEVSFQAFKTISFIAKQAEKVILSSAYCEKDCLHLFPVSKGRTWVMPFAVSLDHRTISESSSSQKMLTKYEIPDRFLMVANLFAPTKNHGTLFSALGILKKKGLVVCLICTGDIVDYRNLSFANDILQMLTENQIRNQVYLLGLIPREDQLALYRMAIALLQPSVNEGWSTSVEEAKALGKNLLMSDIPVHLEQHPNNPYVFESMNADGLAKTVEFLWNQTSDQVFPNEEVEREAIETYQDNVRRFGNRFLEIASQ